MTHSIKKIVIVGNDVDAWITALFLKSGLDKLNTNLDITLIEIASHLTEHDFYSVLPSYKTLHKALGANEQALTNSAQSQHFFGQKFVGWNSENSDFIHSYEKLGSNFDGIDFYHYWLKAKKLGLAVSLEDFSLGTTAAKQNIALKNTESHSTPNYGYHLSAIPYVISIARAAIAAGVKHVQSDVNTVTIENDEITSLSLTNGDITTADLYIDASGSKRALINQLRNNNLENWSSSFLCDRVITTSVTAFNLKPGYSLITAFSCGWYGLFPLNDRTGVSIYYSSKHGNKAEVLAEVSALCGIDISATDEKDIKCGIVKEPWIGNCVAVGDAIATLETLDALQLQPLLTSLVQLRELFPVSTHYAIEANTYNRKTRAYIAQLKSFQLSHYLLNTRNNQPFWLACREANIPDELNQKINLFKNFGHISINEFDTFLEESWTLLFNGHGLQPEQHNPLVERISEQDLMVQFVDLLKNIAQEIKQIA